MFALWGSIEGPPNEAGFANLTVFANHYPDMADFCCNVMLQPMRQRT